MYIIVLRNSEDYLKKFTSNLIQKNLEFTKILFFL